MTSREEFEEWFPKMVNGMPDGMIEVFDKMLFTAWQASRESITVDLSNMHLLLCDQHDVVSELNKHGLKVKV